MKVFLVTTIVCLAGLVIVVLAGQTDQMKQRLSVFSSYQTQTEKPLNAIAAAIKDGKAVEPSHVEMLRNATDQTLKVLHSNKLMNPRLEAYEAQWVSIRKIDDGLAFGKRAVPFVQSFTI